MRRLALACGLVVLFASSRAVAEPDARPEVIPVTESVILKADSGAELRVPPGYYVPTTAWNALDAALKAAQDAETRLKAENTSLREAARDDAPRGWGTVLLVAGALAAGILGGAIAY